MPETRGQALEAISEGFLSHRSGLGDWKPVRALRKLASWLGGRMGGSSSSSSSLSSGGRREEEREDGLGDVQVTEMSGGNGDGVGVEDVATPLSAVRSSEKIELGILAVLTPA